MNILFCVNNAYMSKLAATMCSFWESNAANYDETNIFIRNTDVTKACKRELLRLAGKYGFESGRIHFVDAADVERNLEELNVAKFKGNYLTYHKIFGLDLIGAEDRLLVLDADLLIQDDLKPLYNIDMGECPIGAVKEYPTPLNVHGAQKSQEYNGGVWLVDLEMYQKKDVQKKLIDYIHSMPDDWATGDQTLVSLALGRQGMIYDLPLKYNFLLNYLAYKPDDFYYIHNIKDGFYSRREFIEAQKRPVIIHLILGFFMIPPWFAQGTEPIKSKWKEYLSDTIWRASYLEKLDNKWIAQVQILNMMKVIISHNVFNELMKKLVSYMRGESFCRKLSDAVRVNKLANRILLALRCVGIDQVLLGILYKYDEAHPTESMKQSVLYFESHRQEIRQIRMWLADEKSRQVWSGMIKFRETMNYRWHPRKEKSQYFVEDIIQFQEGEVFIDCGGFDGMTSIDFAKRAEFCGGGYKRIVIFEPDQANFKVLKKNVKGREGICIFNKGVWDKTKKVKFYTGQKSSSGVVDLANQKRDDKNIKMTAAVAMDDVAECQDATFIKMDVEGAELMALKGAEKIIKRNKPKLAVCIYHSDQDMLEIIQYIHQLVPEYKLYVRQHSNMYYETVLYAVYEG